MSKRFLVYLAVLASGPLALVLAWPLIAAKLRTADLTLALVTQPRAEVVASGYLRNHEAAPFSLETLLIEEPGQKEYRRQVTLDADRRFELALGEPKEGRYHVSALTRKANWLTGIQEQWLPVGELVVSRPLAPRKVRAQDFDYQGLLLLVITMLAAQALFLVFLFAFRGARLPTRIANQSNAGADPGATPAAASGGELS